MKPGMAPEAPTKPPKVRKARVSPEKGKKSQEPFIGWKGAAFVMRTPTGLKQRLTGPHSAIVATLRKLLPAWYEVAVDNGHSAFAQRIHEEADNIGIVIYRNRERDIDGFRFEVVNGPSVHAAVADSFETEREARADAKRRNTQGTPA